MNRALTIGLGTVLGALLVHPVSVLGAEADADQALRSKIATDIVVGNVPVVGEGEIETAPGDPVRQHIIGHEGLSVPVLPEVRLSEGQAGVFEQIDEDQGGYISRNEARVNRIEPEWEALDTDDNGRVDLSDFSAFEVDVETEGALPAHAEGLNLHYVDEVSVPTFRD